MLRRDVDLAAWNTLALPGRAALYARIESVDQFGEPELARVPRFILGGGSNLVLTGDFDGLVLHMAIPGRRLVREDADAWYVEAGAGEDWHGFVQWTLERGWPGLENLGLIPGTVGAAPIQNIGAYGLEIADRFHQLTAFDFQTGSLVVFNRKDCRFGYRDSVFKQEGWHLCGRFAIVSVTFRLPKAWSPAVGYAELAKELAARYIAAPNAVEIAEAVIAIRQRKLPDPATLPNAGSFFHNPVVDAATLERLIGQYPNLPRYFQPDGGWKLAAGWLIEQAGWKGRQLGPVGMYEKQALILVNRGGAHGADVQRTMMAVQGDVLACFGIRLTPEPVFL